MNTPVIPKCCGESLKNTANLARLLWLKDSYTFMHSKRVAEMSLKTAKHMNVDEKYYDELYVAAFLHDIGKIDIDTAILRKNTSLNTQERKIIENHPVIGENLLIDLPDFSRIRSAVRHHHEKIDGKGYPDALEADEIPLFSKIIAVADSYDAMSTRSYNSFKNRSESKTEILEKIGSQFDMEAAISFMDTF